MLKTDPEGEVILTIDSDKENPTRFVFRPWTSRELREYQAGMDRKEMTLAAMSEFVDSQVAKKFVRIENGGDLELDDLQPRQKLELLNARALACWMSPEDKKKSES